MNANTIAKLLSYQATGRGFDDFWADVDSHVHSQARDRLRRRRVRGWKTFDDLAAVDEVVQQVRCDIFTGTGPGGKGRFNPALGGGGLDGLRGWLFRIVENTTIKYCRKYRSGGRGKIKVGTFTDFALNDPPGGHGVLKAPLKFDPDRFELIDLVNDCLRSLPPEQRQVYQLRFGETLTHREAAQRLATSAPTVCRREKTLHAAVQAWFRDRGIDAAGLLLSRRKPAARGSDRRR